MKKSSTLFIAALALAFGLAAGQTAAAAVNEPYLDAKTFGIGSMWQSEPESDTAGTTQGGFFTGRYWFGNRFGLDAGLGLGFPQMTPNNVTTFDLEVEPMYALIQKRHTILYADAQISPAFSFVGSGGGTTTILDMGAGVGFERAFDEIPQAAWFVQWNPLGFDITMPPHGASTTFGMGVFGSVQTFTAGFHYYL